MPDRSVYLIEAGLAGELPGVTERTVGASFPFWGTHALFDFALAALRPLASEPCWLVCDTRDRAVVVQTASRWGKAAVRQRDAEDGLVELRKLVAVERAPWVVISSLSYAVYIEPGAIAATDFGAGKRLKADGTPLPVYILPRESLLGAIDDAARGGLRGFVMSYLPERVREHVDVPGKVFFVDNLMQLWDAQHFLRENIGGGRASRYLEALDAAQQPTAEAHISDSGWVKSSLIGSGAHIDGTVVDSVIFPGVAVRRGAEVNQCVVMSGARIGADARVTNTMVMAQQELVGDSDTVGGGAVVGETRNAAHTHNGDYPRHIARGLTVVGMNASIPGGIEVEAGCYIGPGVGAALKGMKRLERGSSVR